MQSMNDAMCMKVVNLNFVPQTSPPNHGLRLWQQEQPVPHDVRHLHGSKLCMHKPDHCAVLFHFQAPL